jgi:predicted RND superfamily exporter protein
LTKRYYYVIIVHISVFYERSVLHEILESKFKRFGEFIADNPWKVIVFVLLLLIFPLSYAPKVKMDTSTEGFMHPEDPVLINYEKFKEQFGRDERIGIAIASNDIWSVEFLKKLKRLHLELENNLPYLEEVNSLYNARNTRGEGDSLIVEDLLENFPKDKSDVEKIKELAMRSEFYKNLFINKDGNVTTIMIETKAFVDEGGESVDEMFDQFDESEKEEIKRVPLSDEQNSQIVKKVREIIAKYDAPNFKIYHAGSPSVLDALKSIMRSDMQKFTRVTIAIIIVFLFLIYRRVSATFYPILVIVLSLLTTVGLMAYFGVYFKLPTQIVPSLLIAVSIGATMHVLSIFFDRFDERGDKKEAIAYTLGHSGLAIAMTGITTAIGIASFAGSEVAPVADMGVFASLGVLISLFLTLTLLPALLSVTKLKPRPKREPSWLDKLMRRLAFIPNSYPKTIFTVSMIVVFVSLLLASKLKTSHHPLEWFPKDDPNYIGTKFIDKNLRGTLTSEVVIDFHKENAWQDPVKLSKLEEVTKKLEKYDDGKTYIGKVISLNTIVKESNRALHENNQSYYTIPKKQDLLSQELLLFENSGSDDLEDIVDSQFSKLRVTHKLPWRDSIKGLDALKTIERSYKETFPEADVVETGMIPMLVNTFTQSIRSSVISYFIAFSLIAISMMFIMGSVRLGLISMIPNLTPILMGMSLMYIYNMPLDMFTLLIGSIAIGLAVDDTIHFMHNFKRYYLQTGDAKRAVEETFFTTGKAMVITSIVLSLGFYAYMGGVMESVQNFGFITGSVIIFALLADLLLAPALMILISKKGWVK